MKTNTELLLELVKSDRERRCREATDSFNELMSNSFMDGGAAEQALKEHEDTIRLIRQGKDL
jgi:hypothetical protein